MILQVMKAIATILQFVKKSDCDDPAFARAITRMPLFTKAIVMILHLAKATSMLPQAIMVTAMIARVKKATAMPPPCANVIYA